jgi:16S rRNA (guanine1207-N2)-methyltransferase
VDRDVYFKKEVALEYEGHSLRLRVAQDLFSSFYVDKGTRLLLRSLSGTDRSGLGKVLDLGCGYGPLGLALKAAGRNRAVHMVDRDALAVGYAGQNAELNGLTGVETYGSLGYDDVASQDFDLIVSNIPGKAGESAVSHLLLDAALHLRQGGLVAIVVVAPLAPKVARILDDDSGIDVSFRDFTSSYSVFHYSFASPASRPSPVSGLSRGVYRRSQMSFIVGGVDCALETAHDLPEFDTVGYQSELVIGAMMDLGVASVARALAFNPGQGHVPLALWKIVKPGSIGLVDRDLLALRYAKKNLELNGCATELVTTSYRTGVLIDGDQPFDLVVGVLRENEGTEVHVLTVEQAIQQLAAGGHVVVAASSTAISRLAKRLGMHRGISVARRKRRKGNAVLTLRRTIPR